MVDEHGGRFPDDLDALLALPGIGPYTARAVLAFAFERDVGVVDTNVGAGPGPHAPGRRLGAREVQERADALVPAGEGWAWNQAMLDLGATVCTEPVAGAASGARCADVRVAARRAAPSPTRRPGRPR